MKEILKYLKVNGYKIDKDSVIYDENKITHIYTSKEILAFCIIAPHDGNENKFLLRINPIRTLDRWGVCDLEIPFKTDDGLIQYLEWHELDTYKKLLAIYVDSYRTNEWN